MSTTVDPAALDAFMGRAIADLGATISAGMVVLGDRLGLYRSLAAAGPATASELAERTATAEPYIREWLNNQAAGGYLDFDAESGRFGLTAERALALADEDGPAFFPGSMQLALGVLRDLPKIEERFRTGAGLGWHEHDPDLFEGTERFFRPSYVANLVEHWLPALDGVEARLRAGGRVADVGCGHGASTILMAEAFPEAAFVGTDYHEGSVRWARRRAREAGVADRVSFEVAAAAELPGVGYDLVTMFDCLHDMGDPVGAATRARHALRPDGTLMVVEPRAGDRAEDNHNPLGRVFYAASVLICTPCALSQDAPSALGPQAGPARIMAVLRAAGFSRVRIAAEGPASFVYDARL